MADRDPLAGEFALGLLEGDERAAAVRRLLAEPGFAADVEWWRTQFAALFDLWPEHDAPPQLAARVETSLDALTRQSGRATDGVTTLRSGARSPWPWLAAASSAIAACLLLFIAVEPRSAPPVSQPIPAARPSSVLVAMLGDAKSPVAAVYDPATGALRVAAGPGVPDARVAQLWVIGGDGVPHSLGLLAARPTVLATRGADRGRIAPGATLAISIEPLGGSPTGLPTGPVVATGVVARV